MTTEGPAAWDKRRLGVVASLLIGLAGCGMLGGSDDSGGAPPPPPADPLAAEVAAAHDKLAAGQFEAAAMAFAALDVASMSVDALVEAAYVKVLEGDPEAADALLVNAEGRATPEQAQQIRVRRALVFIEGKSDDILPQLLADNPLPAAKMLLAEYYVSTADFEQARPILQQISRESNEFGTVAQQYLERMDHPNRLMRPGAEAAALWSLGYKHDAVDMAKNLFGMMKGKWEELDATDVLVWAGRSAALGHTSATDELLALVPNPPPNQAWRVDATRAINLVGKNDVPAALEAFAALDAGDAPEAGVIDARATAIGLCMTDEEARSLAGDIQAESIAVALLGRKMREDAKSHAPSGSLLARHLGGA